MTLKAPYQRKGSGNDYDDSSSGSSGFLALSAASSDTDVSLRLECRPVDTRLSFYKSVEAESKPITLAEPEFKSRPTLERSLQLSAPLPRAAVSSRYKSASQIGSPLDRELVIKSAGRLARPLRLSNTASYSSHPILTAPSAEATKLKAPTAAPRATESRGPGLTEIRTEARRSVDYVSAWIKYHQRHGYLRGPILPDQLPVHESETRAEENLSASTISPSTPAEKIPEAKIRWKSPKTVTLRDYSDHTIAADVNSGQLPIDHQPHPAPRRRSSGETKSQLIGSMMSGFSNHLRSPSVPNQPPLPQYPAIDLTISPNQPEPKPLNNHRDHCWTSDVLLDGSSLAANDSSKLLYKNHMTSYDWLDKPKPKPAARFDWSSRQRPDVEHDWRNDVSLRMPNEESSFTQVVKLNKTAQKRLSHHNRFLSITNSHYHSTFF